MTTVNEIPRVHRWLRTMLGSDATLVAAATGGIHRGFIREGKGYPAIVYQFLAPLDDTPGNAGSRVWQRARYIVKVVCEGNNDGAAQTVADRIEAVLEAVTGGVADIGIDYCVRKKPVYYVEQPVVGDARKSLIHLGGEYEIAARYAG